MLTISTRIPVVFTGVAVPGEVGCPSLSKAGPGFTGASLYLDPLSAFRITKHALPRLTTLGIVHSDDDNAVAFVEEAKATAKTLGITVLTKQVGKSDSLKPAARELMAGGAQAAKILKTGARPESLPVGVQEDLTILVDLGAAKRLGINLPMDILMIARPVESMRK